MNQNGDLPRHGNITIYWSLCYIVSCWYKSRYKLKWDPRFRCHMIILNSARPGGIVSLKMSEMLPYSAGDYRREVLGKVLELGYNG